jgi:hypothetical protein
VLLWGFGVAGVVTTLFKTVVLFCQFNMEKLKKSNKFN